MRIVLIRFITSEKNIITHKYLKTLIIRTKQILFSFVLNEGEFTRNSNTLQQNVAS